MKHKHLLTFGSVMLVAWALGTFLFVYFYPHLVNNGYKKAIVNQGFGDGPIPINTLYTEPQTLFAEPLASQSASGSNLMTAGGTTTRSLRSAGSTSPKGRKSCMCRTSPGATTACSSPTRWTVPTSPMSARAPLVHRRVITSLRGRIGKDRCRADDADILAEQLRARPRPHPCVQRQRPPDCLWPCEADTAHAAEPKMIK